MMTEKIHLTIDPEIENRLRKEQVIRLKEELSRLDKYVQDEVDLRIEINENQSGLTKRIKPKRFSDEEPYDEPYYSVVVDIDHLEVLTHEICHVIDRVSTKQQYSKTKEFKPLLDLYKQANKEEIKEIKKSNRPKDLKKKHIKFWKHTYRNGDAPSEIFARFCDYYLRERESLISQ